MKHRILVVDPAPDVHVVVSGVLARNHSLVCVSTLKEASEQIAKAAFDLLILDVNLPDGDGFHFCANLRADPITEKIPVIFLSSRTATADAVLGFSLGAEDYIVKPFDQFEFRARVEARLRKLHERRLAENVLSKHRLRIDLDQRRVVILDPSGERPIDLTPLEFKLLHHLFRHADHVFSRDQVIDAVWGDAVHVIDRTVDMHVSKLRKKLSGTGFTIKSVHGVGYRFCEQEN